MQVTYLGIAASASSHSKHFQAYITAMDGNFLSRFINQRSITMKKVISVILMMAFAVCSYAANNSDPSKVFFKMDHVTIRMSYVNLRISMEKHMNFGLVVL